jgi:type IV pilus assembly protein PilV
LVFGGAIVANVLTSRAQRGVSLLEVMIAVLIFSIGILGIALLQIKGAQFTKESASRTAAILQARSLADAMRANPEGARPAGGADSFYLYDGDTQYTQDDCDATDLSSPQLIAKRDLACWMVGLTQAIPKPSVGTKIATVSKDALGTLVVRVSWTGVADVSDSDDQSYSFSYMP